MNIGGGGGGGARFRILGGGGGGGRARGSKFSPAPNQCQILTFLTLKDNIANLRNFSAIQNIALKSILLEIPPNKMKCTYIKSVHL